MKLNPRQTADLIAGPDRAAGGILLHGADPMRIDMARRDLLASHLGPAAEEEMRLARLAGADLRKDPAALIDAQKAVGFFPGPRAVWVDGATDGLAPAMAAALDAREEGDALILATAAQLPARSKLRQVFEKHPAGRACAFYDDPPGRAEIEDLLARDGLTADGGALVALEGLGRAVGPAALRGLTAKLALLLHGEGRAATAEDVAAVAPAAAEAATDDVIDAVLDGRVNDLAPLLRRAEAQGTTPTALLIAAQRAVRRLHQAAASGVEGLRPPLYGPRRDRLARQARAWGTERAEAALHALLEADRTLRSAGRTAPEDATAQRALIRLAMMPR
ncbi:DNA polymerase III delta subunit [Hasllibacter halocynthiae]|uniref:DNA-directed DNA polymerase n=1 Tax=Hasllibacter halocynthiae TaxID=595589 RepID=A0A2T0X1F8_9RHOB|nr:DNA polymerase III subunit delta [Hasllibacter halocynthiae]PRY92786.1 DNA polymerase III delta subunit [Hasllibacter halocynthiae]